MPVFTKQEKRGWIFNATTPHYIPSASKLNTCITGVYICLPGCYVTFRIQELMLVFSGRENDLKIKRTKYKQKSCPRLCSVVHRFVAPFNLQNGPSSSSSHFMSKIMHCIFPRQSNYWVNLSFSVAPFSYLHNCPPLASLAFPQVVIIPLSFIRSRCNNLKRRKMQEQSFELTFQRYIAMIAISKSCYWNNRIKTELFIYFVTSAIFGTV